MQIKTKTFHVTTQDLKKLIVRQYFSQRKRMLIISGSLALLSLLFLLVNKDSVPMAIYFTFFFIYFLIAPYLINMRKLQSASNFVPRYCEIDEDFISMYYEDGCISKFRFDHLVKASKMSEFYFLYITEAGQFHYIPVAAFESEKDINRFELLLQGKQLMKLF